MLKDMVRFTLNKFMPYGPAGLFALAFMESSFFPVPPDVLLIALALADPKSSFFLASICTAGSVLGAAFGYFIGIKGGKPILRKFISDDKISMVHAYFTRYDVWAIGIAAFTPIPYKVFTIAGGVFYIPFWRFVFVSILARGARFFLVGAVLYFFGAAARLYVARYFEIFSILFVLLLVLGFYVIKVVARRHVRSTGNHEKI
ncbi:MAG: YqaA family protein [Candidatus Omnitrophota bacterium]